MTSDRPDDAGMIRRHSAAAGAGGLSIVVPVCNEAAGLAALDGRICTIAAALSAERGLPLTYLSSAVALPARSWRPA